MEKAGLALAPRWDMESGPAVRPGLMLREERMSKPVSASVARMGNRKREEDMLRDAVERNRLEEVRRLYEASFPKSEKKPFGFIMKKRKKGLFDVLSIEDGEGRFCGLAIMMLSGGRALLDYLAIEPRCQGSGIGSSTLQELRERYGSGQIVVEIESTAGLEEAAVEKPAAEVRGNQALDARERPADVGCSVGNVQERIRRKAFYLRNGMVPMEFLVDLFGVEMEVLTFGSELTFREYHGIYAGVLPKNMAGRVKLSSR